MAGYLDSAVLVVTNGEGQVLGSCFRAPILDSSQPGTYLISTAHGLLVDARRGDRVDVVDQLGVRHRADVIICPPPDEPDISLLYVDQFLGPPVECVVPPPDGPVVVRGGLSGLDTRIGSLRCRHSGLESLADKQVMDVVIEDLGFLEAPLSDDRFRSIAYAGLRGMSGAPVCHVDDGLVLVYGMVVRRNTAGLANRVYALPVDAMGRFLGQQGFPLRVTRRLDSTSRAADLLMGRLINRTLDSPGGLHQLWADASELFYAGVPVDATLRAAIQQPKLFGLADPRIADVEFLLARLLFKCGDEQGGLALLRHARGLIGRGSTSEHRHLAALIDLRMMLHSARDLNAHQRRSVFEHSVGAYEQVHDASDDERAYEIASAVGSEANQLASDNGFVHRECSARQHFSDLFVKHTALLTNYPQVLRDKQEIVNIGLAAVEIMWDVAETRGPTERAETLAALAARGRLAAGQRGNGIFYAQMLLADAIAARMSGRSHRAFALSYLVGMILATSHIRLSHEGVQSYLSYAAEHGDASAEMLQIAHSVDVPDARTALLRTDLVPRADRPALEAALTWCESIHAGEQNIRNIFELEGLIRDL